MWAWLLIGIWQSHLAINGVRELKLWLILSVDINVLRSNDEILVGFSCGAGCE